jgi:TetR/AcrR family transcriptional regulator
MGTIRDAARTRAKIVQAAVSEFAAKGMAGARIESIAARAKINKQLVYHYFESKEDLFLEIVEEHMLKVEHLEEDPPSVLEDLLVARFQKALTDPTWLRFMAWEAAEFPETGKIMGEKKRAASLHNQRNAIMVKQFQGSLPADVDASLLQLAILALATYPIVFAQVTKMVTSMMPADPKFVEGWSNMLRKLGSEFVGPKQQVASKRSVPRARKAAASPLPKGRSRRGA